MAQAANTFATNDMVGVREDLTDVIWDISPTDTPFINSVAHPTATQTKHEWQTDSLAAAASNAQIEGDAFTAAAASPTTRVDNLTQVSWKIPRVTGTGRAVDTAGRSDELDYQMLKAGRELRRDMEKVLLDNDARVTGTDTVAQELGAMGTWIATNDDFGSGGASPATVGTSARTDGTQRAFTEDQLKTVNQLIFDQGGMPNTLMVGAFNRQIASSFSAGRTVMQKAEDSTLRASFDVYAGDFEELRIVPNRFQRGRDAFVLQMDMWAVPFLPGRQFSVMEVAKTHDSDSRVVLSEYTLEARNEAASGGIFDLTTS